MDSKLIIQLMRWGKRKHPTRPKMWIRNRYLFRDVKTENRDFGMAILIKTEKLLVFNILRKLLLLGIRKLPVIKVSMIMILSIGLAEEKR